MGTAGGTHGHSWGKAVGTAGGDAWAQPGRWEQGLLPPRPPKCCLCHMKPEGGNELSGSCQVPTAVNCPMSTAHTHPFI